MKRRKKHSNHEISILFMTCGNQW